MIMEGESEARPQRSGGLQSPPLPAPSSSSWSSSVGRYHHYDPQQQQQRASVSPPRPHLDSQQHHHLNHATPHHGFNRSAAGAPPQSSLLETPSSVASSTSTKIEETLKRVEVRRQSRALLHQQQQQQQQIQRQRSQYEETPPLVATSLSSARRSFEAPPQQDGAQQPFSPLFQAHSTVGAHGAGSADHVPNNQFSAHTTNTSTTATMISHTEFALLRSESDKHRRESDLRRAALAKLEAEHLRLLKEMEENKTRSFEEQNTLIQRHKKEMQEERERQQMLEESASEERTKRLKAERDAQVAKDMLVNNKQLQERIAFLEALADDRARELELLRDTKKQYEQRIFQLETNDQTKVLLGKIQSMDETQESQSRQLDELYTLLTTEQQRRAGVEKTLQIAKETSDVLTQQLSELTVELDNAAVKLQSKDQELIRLQHAQKELREAKQSAEDAAQQHADHLEETIQDLKLELHRKACDRTDLERKLADSEGKVEQTRQQAARLQAELEEQIPELDLFAKRLQEARELASQHESEVARQRVLLDESVGREAALHGKIDALTRELSAVQTNVDRLSDELETARFEELQHARLASDLQQCIELKEEKEKEIFTLQQTVSTLRERVSELDEANRRVAYAEQRLSDLKQRDAERHDELRRTVSERNAADERCEQLQEELRACEARATVAETRRRVDEQRREELERKVHLLEVAASETYGLQAKYLALQQFLSNSTTDSAKAAELNASLTQDLRDCERVLTERNDEILRLRDICRQAEEQKMLLEECQIDLKRMSSRAKMAEAREAALLDEFGYARRSRSSQERSVSEAVPAAAGGGGYVAPHHHSQQHSRRLRSPSRSVSAVVSAASSVSPEPHSSRLPPTTSSGGTTVAPSRPHPQHTLQLPVVPAEFLYGVPQRFSSTASSTSAVSSSPAVAAPAGTVTVPSGPKLALTTSAYDDYRNPATHSPSRVMGPDTDLHRFYERQLAAQKEHEQSLQEKLERQEQELARQDDRMGLLAAQFQAALVEMRRLKAERPPSPAAAAAASPTPKGSLAAGRPPISPRGPLPPPPPLVGSSFSPSAVTTETGGGGAAAPATVSSSSALRQEGPNLYDLERELRAEDEEEEVDDGDDRPQVISNKGASVTTSRNTPHAAAVKQQKLRGSEERSSPLVVQAPKATSSTLTREARAEQMRRERDQLTDHVRTSIAALFHSPSPTRQPREISRPSGAVRKDSSPHPPVRSGGTTGATTSSRKAPAGVLSPSRQ